MVGVVYGYLENYIYDVMIKFQIEIKLEVKYIYLQSFNCFQNFWLVYYDCFFFCYFVLSVSVIKS